MKKLNFNVENCKAVANMMTKKVMKTSNLNKAVMMTVKMGDDYRINLDGSVIPDDDDCKFLINVHFEEKQSNGRYAEIAQYNSGIMTYKRENVFAKFNEHLEVVLMGMVRDTMSPMERFANGREITGFEVMKIEKVTDEVLCSLTEDFTDISADHVVSLTNSPCPDEVGVYIDEYGAYYMSKDVEKVNSHIAEGLRWLVDRWGMYKSVKDCGEYWEVEKPVFADKNTAKNDPPMLENPVSENDAPVKNDAPMLDVAKYICLLDDKPTYVKEKDVKVVDEGDKLDIVMFRDYHIEIYKDKRDMCMDGAWCNVGGYGKQDLLFAYEILDNRDEILALVQNEDIGSIIENALESAMDDGNEYYDDKICQIGDLYVSYTSPCDEFPDGCVCVVNEKGCWIGGEWCSVKDSGFAVDFLVETLEKYNRVA